MARSLSPDGILRPTGAPPAGNGESGEKGRSRNLVIPDSVYRRLTLEAQRRGTDNSKLVTKILDRELPTDIRIVVVDEKPPAVD